MDKIKIAMFVHGLSGGVGQFIINYFGKMPSQKYNIDIITMYIESDTLLKKYKDNNINVIKIPSKKESIIKNYKAINKIFKSKDYDIAYANLTLTNFVPLFIAKKNRIKVRISHSHLSGKNSILNNIMSFLTLRSATVYLACGKKAGEFLYKKNNFKIIKNAIDIKKFAFNKEIREAEREKLKIPNDAIVLGNVGRFTKQKNHKLIIEIFEAFHKEHPNSYLLLIGDGELKITIENIVREKKLTQYVKFLGEIRDPYVKFQAMDLFIQPSLFEGLSIAAIEAQGSGLPCLFSNTVDHDVKVLDSVKFLDLNSSLSLWVNACSSLLMTQRTDQSMEIKEKGFDILNESRKFDDYLQNLVKQR